MRFISATLWHKDPIIKNLSLDILPGEWWFIIGPSGSWKSTLLQTIFGTLPLLDGELFDDEGYATSQLWTPERRIARRKKGMIFQDYQLIQHKTVAENVAYALEISGYSEDIHKRTQDLLRYVGLSHKTHVFPEELSWWEKQRVAIARALIHDPWIILADEPTGNLDTDNVDNIISFLQKLHSEWKTIIFATHDTSLLAKIEGAKVYKIKALT